ncbi:RNA-directed DNA polymerase from transposon X-element-like 2, partial [Homarus americanus]
TSERNVTNGRKIPQEASEGKQHLRHRQYVPSNPPVAEPPTFKIPTVMKYKIPKETEFNHAYEVVVALEVEYKNIKFSVIPNLVGDLILSPQDHNTAKILSARSPISTGRRRKQPEWSYYDILWNYNRSHHITPKSDQGRALCYESGQSTDKTSACGHQGDSHRGGRPRQLGNLQVASFCPRTTTMRQMSGIWTSPIQMLQKSEMWHLQPKPQDRNVYSKTQGRKHHDSQVPKLWKETSRLEHIMPREERANESYNGKNSTTKHNRSTSEHIRVGSTATENSQPNTHTAPTVRGFLPCTSSTRLQDKIEDTATKSVHAGNRDKSVDSTTAAPQLYSSKSTQHYSIGGEHHIAWDTATPSGDYPTEYTPACQSTSSIHRRTFKTNDHYYDKKVQEDQTPKTTQLQVKQTTPLCQISDKKKNLPSERSLKTVKPQAPCNRSRGTEQQAQTVSKHTITDKRDSTLKREEKTSELPPKTSGIPPPAPPLEQVPKKQPLFLTDEEETDSTMNAESNYSTSDEEIMIEQPHLLVILKITQWNVQDLSNKQHTVQAAAIAKNIDVFILQETLMSKDKQFRLTGYQQYSVPKGPNSHGSMILVRATIPSSEVEPVHCGDGVEAQAVRIHLANDSLVVYNIYKPPPKRLVAGELLTEATQELMLIAGDFNAHHPTINSTTRMNQDGHHLVGLLTDVPEITLINTREPTHILGGTLDLTFISTELVPGAQWEVDDELTSDHFATTTTLKVELLPPPPRPPPRWNTKKANWKLYEDELQK